MSSQLKSSCPRPASRRRRRAGASDAAAPRRRSRGCPRPTSWPPRQRNCQTAPPFRRSSAPWPSAVLVTSTAGARWKRDGEGDRLVRASCGRPAISRSSPPSMAAVAGEVEPALVDQAVAADIAVMAGLERGRCRRSRRGPARPRRRPCRAMPSSWIAVELRSPRVSVEWAAVVRRAWHRPAGSAPFGLAGAAAIDDQPRRRRRCIRRRASRRRRRPASAAAAAARRRRPARSPWPAAADSPSRAPGGAGGRQCRRRRSRRRRGGGSPCCRPASSTAPRRPG